MILHHLESSRSRRLIWLFEELDLDYEIKTYARHPKTLRAPAELRKVHPLGKAPIVTDGDLVLAETGAIIEHVLETRGEGRLQPAPGSEAARQYRYFMHYSEGSLMPPLLVRLIFEKLEAAKMPFFIKPIARSIARKVDENYTAGEIRLHMDFLEETLSGQNWFAGDTFTAADIQMSYPVEALLTRGRRPPEETVRLRAFAEEIRRRPAYQRALEQGGPDVL